MLAFSKEASAADELVGRSILYNWPVVGWCVGTIKARNTDGRITKTPVATPEAAPEGAAAEGVAAAAVE